MADLGLPNTGVSLLEARAPSANQASVVSGFAVRRNDWLLLPAVLIVLLILLPLVLNLDPTQQNLQNRLTPPAWLRGDWHAPLGTDGLGRNLLDRVLVGSRLSLGIGLVVTVLSCALGVLAGLIATIGPRFVDATLTLFSEVTLSLPLILIGVVVTATVGPSRRNLIVLMVFSGWIGFARLTRLQARQIRQTDFVLASRSIGASSWTIALRHLLPNLLPAILTLACQNVASVMLWEASLTYLGLGLPIQQVSLGGMIRDGQAQLFDAWWVSFMPGALIAFVVIALSLLADWLRAELDPINRRRWRFR